MMKPRPLPTSGPSEPIPLYTIVDLPVHVPSSSSITTTSTLIRPATELILSLLFLSPLFLLVFILISVLLIVVSSSREPKHRLLAVRGAAGGKVDRSDEDEDGMVLRVAAPGEGRPLVVD